MLEIVGCTRPVAGAAGCRVTGSSPEPLDRGARRRSATLARDAGRARSGPAMAPRPSASCCCAAVSEILLCHPTMPAGLHRRRPRRGDRLSPGPSPARQRPPAGTARGNAALRAAVDDRHRHAGGDRRSLCRAGARPCSTSISTNGRRRCPIIMRGSAALDLAGGDESGMWMLELRLPLCRARRRRQAYGRGLARARRRAGGARHAAFAAALRRLSGAPAALSPTAAGARNWRYFEFQLWQEGVARWTEIALGRASADPAMRADAGARETRDRCAGLGASRPRRPGPRSRSMRWARARRCCSRRAARPGGLALSGGARARPAARGGRASCRPAA